MREYWQRTGTYTGSRSRLLPCGDYRAATTSTMHTCTTRASSRVHYCVCACCVYTGLHVNGAMRLACASVQASSLLLAAEACMARCRRCGRCRFVSFSAQHAPQYVRRKR